MQIGNATTILRKILFPSRKRGVKHRIWYKIN